MKKTLIAAAFISPLVAAIPTLALADENVPDTYGYIGAHASEYFFYDNSVIGDVNGLDDSLLPGGQIGWRFSPNWSIQGWYEKSDSVDYKYTGGEAEVEDYYGSLRYHFDEHSLLGFEPYAGINVGEQKINDNDETMTGVEFGLQRAFFKYVLLDLGTRQAYSQDREYWQGQVYAAVNLMFAVGGRETDNDLREAETQPAAVVTADSDGDGVADDRDNCPNTPANAVVDDQGCQVYSSASQQKVNTIYFQFDKANIQGQFNDEVRGAAQNLKDGKEGSIHVDGYTDSTGPSEYNQGLSERRANAVKQELINQYQVDGDKITTQGHGESDPVAPNDTAEGRAKNRRAEITVDTTSKQAEFKDQQ